MTATPARERARRLVPRDAAHVVDLLERDFGDDACDDGRGQGLSEGGLAHQFLLDALDRRQYDRFLLWPSDHPVALLFAGAGGTLVPGGDPVAGPALAEAAEGLGWRVLVGDAALGWSLLEASRLADPNRGLFRRRVNAREQRFMGVRAVEVAAVDALAPQRPDPDGLRPARMQDLDVLVEHACRLHVEDQMGPPIVRSARNSVRDRLSESITREQTWVVQRQGRPVAKADLSLRSVRRGAQIAGVYVAQEARGEGIGGGIVAALVRMLLREGAPGVSLHVRADNAAAIAAYRSAGLVDRRSWLLALR